MGYPFGIVPVTTVSGVADGISSIGVVGSSPNAEAGTIATGVLTLQPADATHPGLVTSGTQTLGGAKTFSAAISASNLSGTNTGDLTLGAVGSSPSANAASLSAQVLTMQPADATHPGVITATDQTFAGTKTFGSAQGVAIGVSGGGYPQIQMTNNFGNLQFGGVFSLIQILAGSADAFHIYDGANDYAKFDTSVTKAITFPSNAGFTFPATLAPSGATQTVDWSTGTSQTVDATSTTGTLVLTFSNPVSGGRYVLKTIGKTGRLWTFPTVLTAGGTGITPTATDGAIDVYELVYDGTNYLLLASAKNLS